MSDSGSDSGSDFETSSGDLVPSRRASIQYEETNERDIANKAENQEIKNEERTKVAEDIASDSDTASVSTKGTKDEILHLEWQHGQSPYGSDLDIRLIE